MDLYFKYLFLVFQVRQNIVNNIINYNIIIIIKSLLDTGLVTSSILRHVILVCNRD